MRVDIDPDETVGELWRMCDAWSEAAACIQKLADDGFPEGSRTRSDNVAAAVVDQPPAVSKYLQERAWNLARMLRAVHGMAFDTEPGKLFLNPTLLYPLMRAALEDAATVVWLQAPDARKDRLARALRALHQDASYFTRNQLLLAAAASELDRIERQLADASEQLTSHMESEKVAVREHFVRLADNLKLDHRAVTAKLHTSTPITGVYGDDSLERVVWGILSDLAHFSFLMLRHSSESLVPGTGVPLLHVSLIQFARTLNRVCDDAIVALQRAAATTW
ncbi:MAG TPA: hypothetical protein VGC45_12475 [Gryllotalpicola sp.]